MALVFAATPPVVDYRAGGRDVTRRDTDDSDDNVTRPATCTRIWHHALPAAPRTEPRTLERSSSSSETAPASLPCLSHRRRRSTFGDRRAIGPRSPRPPSPAPR